MYETAENAMLAPPSVCLPEQTSLGEIYLRHPLGQGHPDPQHPTRQHSGAQLQRFLLNTDGHSLDTTSGTDCRGGDVKTAPP